MAELRQCLLKYVKQESVLSRKEQVVLDELEGARGTCCRSKTACLPAKPLIIQTRYRMFAS